MNIKDAIDKISKQTNAGGQLYLAFPYTSSIGNETEQLLIQVPIRSDQPSAADKKALLEAVILQGGMGRWIQKNDGSVWLMPAGS